MSQNKKAEALIRAIEEKLRLRGAANIVKLNEAAIRISESAAPVDGENNMIIRVKPMEDDIARKDALGLAQRVYNPQICEILLEEGATGLQKQLSEAIFEISKAGLAIDVWQQAASSDPVESEADFTGATKLFSLKDLLNPTLADV
jgi:hypothetical protein